MELDHAKEIDWRCVMNWLYEIYIDPNNAFSNRSDCQAGTTLLRRRQETVMEQ